MTNRKDEADWIETAVRVAYALGLNGMRVRWQLMRLRKRWAARERDAEQWVGHVKYEHKVCPECGSMVDRSETTCPRCGHHVASRGWQVFERIGLSTPKLLSVSSLLGASLLVVYALMMRVAPKGEGFFDMPSDILVRFGAHYPPAIAEGEWWRWGCAIFLHIGLWHLGFNLIALAQIGPMIEKTFGRGKMIFLFMLTGVIANIGSGLWGLPGVAAGASGAVLGLIGVAAGWGQRDGTSVGRNMRNHMLKWMLYTMVFGFFVGADNAAHAVGFGVGAVIGYLMPTGRKQARSMSVPDIVMGVVGTAAAAASIYLAIAPPSTARDWAAEWNATEDVSPMPADQTAWNAAVREACQKLADGDEAGAKERLREAAKHDVDPKYLSVQAWCAYYERMRVDCAKFRAGELEWQKVGDRGLKELLTPEMEKTCAGIEP